MFIQPPFHLVNIKRTLKLTLYTPNEPLHIGIVCYIFNNSGASQLKFKKSKSHPYLVHTNIDEIRFLIIRVDQY